MARRRSKHLPPRRRRERLPLLHTSPGTIPVAPSTPPPLLRVIAYGPDRVVEQSLSDPAELEPLIGTLPVTWISVAGPPDHRLLEAFARRFGVHPMTMEDIADLAQSPKIEYSGDLLFMVLRAAHLRPETSEEPADLDEEQLSVLVRGGVVVTFEERGANASLETVRRRIREGRGSVRISDSSYLAYAILDSVLDDYFPVVAAIGEQLDDLESEILDAPRREQIARIRHLRRLLQRLRRVIWPLRDVVAVTLTFDLPAKSDLRPYLRDALDHATRLMDLVDGDRLLASELMELHLSAVNNRIGEVNKFLTIIATIFIPLGTIASIYGMNFDRSHPWNMPELGWSLGYPWALGLMALTAAAFLIYFWRRGWLGANAASNPPDDRSRSGRG